MISTILYLGIYLDNYCVRNLTVWKLRKCMFSSQRNGVNHTNPYFRSRSTILYASTLYPSVGSVSQIHFYFGPSLALVFFVFLVFWDIENNVLKIYFHLR